MLRIPDQAHRDMAWTEYVLGQLAHPVWPPHEPLLTLVHRLENIVQSFHAHADMWTELDIRMRDVDYAWNDISAWPLDVWSPWWTDTEQIYIGSVPLRPNKRHLWRPSDNCGVHASFVRNACQGGAR